MCDCEDVEDHSRTIIHIDIDCFYAQVEMIKNPRLYQVPLGVQQKNIVVTCNYVARKYGVNKCMLVSDALRVCPTLELVKGEDLYEYRKLSYQVTSYLQKYSDLVERLGLDENYVDLTNLVNERFANHTNNDLKLSGNLFSANSEICQCGCYERLRIGSIISQEIRDGLKKDLKLTTCAGIAHNKLLAKLVGSLHKPNQQTTIFPNSAVALMLSLSNVSKIPGIGNVMSEALENLNIKTVEELQNSQFETLKLALNSDKARWLLDLSYGKDNAPVKSSGRPQSIGLEDSCKLLNVETEIKEKFHQLLMRLIILVSEDGRIPTTIKVTIRKFDSTNKVSHRETKQCNISSNLFTIDKLTHMITLNEQSEKKLLSIIMNLFKKLVNISQSYHITLLGLSFTKFKDRVGGKNSIASYFIKDVAVQSVTSIESTDSAVMPKIFQDCGSYTDGSETEIEPSPKKTRYGSLVSRHRQLNDVDYSSPSKLRVAELRLNSRDSDQPECTSDFEETATNSTSISTSEFVHCPPNASEEVFRQLPSDVQRELWEDWKHTRSQQVSDKPSKKPRTNTLLNYFLKN
ncbi:hypothetical protein RN001_001290 [Aquatica leii]|uniref:UmuC domain-containing protein n=1 Tax=Aquatica leii TaxID=1421715 RepID=A0AAN7Q3U9_9COLE|nr:hypothetical protein RN001_001290 [Aquatica leii]